MSTSAKIFDETIKDAQALLSHFEKIHKESPEDAEVLKRAGLVMAFTAWETYVEDRIREAVQARLRMVSGSPIGQFVSGKLEEELKRFHTPNSDKTKRLFLDYLQVDVTAGWKWSNFETTSAKKRLDALISKRGDVVHRSLTASGGKSGAHPVKREDLAKAISFLKELVKATDLVLSEN